MQLGNDKLLMAGLMLVMAFGSAQAVDQERFNSANAGLLVLEGDILTAPVTNQRGIGVRPGNRVWEDGIVPYYIDPELQPYVQQIVKKAVFTWNRVGGISLVEINPYDAPNDYLHFIPAEGCASWVGRQGGVQAVWTAPSCSAGSMIHEIGHAIGLEHEHTRPDRDQFINIHWDNITPEKRSNFDISDHGKRTYGPYDYASIMHYGELFFSANGQQTIEPLLNTDAAIGQRIAPSAGDIESIARLYASDISLVSNVVNESGRSEVTLLVTNESQQGANDLLVELQVNDAVLLSNSNDEWSCSTYDGMLQCNKERLSGQEQSTIVLLLDQSVSESQLQPTLGSNTPDANLANNLGGASPAAARPTQEVYADQQLTANAGSMGYSLGALLIMGMVRIRRFLG